MKIALLFNSDVLAFPVIRYLKEANMLVGIAVPERSALQLLTPLAAIGFNAENTGRFSENGWKSEMKNWLDELMPDAVFVFAFPWKISRQLLEQVAGGFYNFHFGLFPKYKGADPIFWQIRNQEAEVGLTVHKMNQEMDGGPVVWVHKMPLYAGENYAMFGIRAGNEAVIQVTQLVDALSNQTLKEEVQVGSADLELVRKPDEADLRIQWGTQSAENIEALVLASNPKYGGATTYLRSDEIRVLEVARMDMPVGITAYKPGTVVHADAIYGLIVACFGGGFLRLLTLHMRQGYLSGVKLFQMGVQIEEQFN